MQFEVQSERAHSFTHSNDIFLSKVFDRHVINNVDVHLPTRTRSHYINKKSFKVQCMQNRWQKIRNGACIYSQIAINIDLDYLHVISINWSKTTENNNNNNTIQWVYTLLLDCILLVLLKYGSVEYRLRAFSLGKLCFFFFYLFTFFLIRINRG